MSIHRPYNRLENDRELERARKEYEDSRRGRPSPDGPLLYSPADTPERGFQLIDRTGQYLFIFNAGGTLDEF